MLLLNAESAKSLAAAALSALADRLAQFQLLSLIVLSGPAGEGFGSKSVVILIPFIFMSIPAGLLADRLQKRRILIASNLLRALLVLGLPTLFSYQLPSSTSVSVCIFALLSLIALSVSPYLTLLQLQVMRRDKAEIGNRASNADLAYTAAILVDLAATALIVSVFPLLSTIWMPQETLRICTVAYLVSMFGWWMTKPVAKTSGETIARYFVRHSYALPALRLQCICDALCGLLYVDFYLFCLQGIQLGNEDTTKLFLCILAGFFFGALISIIRVASIMSTMPDRQLIKWLLLQTLILCSFFAWAGTHQLVGPFAFFAGLSSASLFLRSNLQTQKLVPIHLRGQFTGARICLSTTILLASALSAEQMALRYSGLTVMKILSIESAVLCVLLILFRKNVSQRLGDGARLKISGKIKGIGRAEST